MEHAQGRAARSDPLAAGVGHCQEAGSRGKQPALLPPCQLPAVGGGLAFVPGGQHADVPASKIPTGVVPVRLETASFAMG